MNLSIVIQSGGQSRRMGQNKALMPFRGQALIERVAERMRPIAAELLVITNRRLEPVLADQFFILAVLGSMQKDSSQHISAGQDGGQMGDTIGNLPKVEKTHKFTQLLAEDGNLYLVRHDTVADEWELVMFEAVSPGGGPP